MNNLKCTVTDCAYNSDDCCVRDGIRVGEKNARCSFDTKCESFEEKGRDRSMKAHYPDPKTDIECSAELCRFQSGGTCHAKSVLICGCPCDASECETFNQE